MTVNANQALLYNLALDGWPLAEDDILLPNITTQAGAYPVRGALVRVTKASANSSMIMKSITTGDGPTIAFVVNDSGQTIKVFPFIGENQGGSLNASLSIPTAQSGIFVRVPNALGGADWRSAVIP